MRKRVPASGGKQFKFVGVTLQLGYAAFVDLPVLSIGATAGILVFRWGISPPGGIAAGQPPGWLIRLVA